MHGKLFNRLYKMKEFQMQGLQKAAKVIQINTKREKVTRSDRFFYEQINPFGLCVSPLKDTDLTCLEAGDISTLRELTLQYKVVVLRGFSKLKKDELINLSERFGEVIEWIFGSVLDIQVHENPENQLFTTEQVPYHWDGVFASTVPQFQLFQCMKASPIGNGGETIFCDTTKVLDKMTEKQIQILKQISIEYRTNKLADYGGDIVHQLIVAHPETNEDTLRFVEPVETELNRVFLKVNGLGNQPQEEFLDDFVPQLYQVDVAYEHQWKQDDLLLADNHALIHGRNAFSQCIAHHLRRVHIL